MRKAVRALGGLVLAASVLAAPTTVAAAGPVHGIGGPSFDMVIDAGQMCPFAVHWVEDGSKMRTATFTEPNGDTKVLTAGTMWSTIRNVSKPDAAIVVGGGSHADFTYHPDGSFDVQVSGKSAIGFTLPDPPGLWLISGRVHFAVAADGTTARIDPIIGRAVDLCAALE